MTRRRCCKPRRRARPRSSSPSSICSPPPAHVWKREDDGKIRKRGGLAHARGIAIKPFSYVRDIWIFFSEKGGRRGDGRWLISAGWEVQVRVVSK